MNLDDELCLCFHVSKRKVINFIRVEQPKRASQMSECFGAGTGCGWCRPYLMKLFEEGSNAATPTREEYAQMRTRYVLAGKGKPPPGATPIEDGE